LNARVEVDGEVVGAIDAGMLLLVGLGTGDGEEQMDWMARKVSGLRIFADAEGQMNRSLLDIEGELLAVSQFTLHGDCRKGRRPSFVDALEPTLARPLFDYFVSSLESQGIPEVKTGRFGADMKVHLVNDGPVTLWIEREQSA